MDELDLIIDLHKYNKRQGPGSSATTRRALDFVLQTAPNLSEVADMGCGTGTVTIDLAKNIDAKIVGIDLFPSFLEVLKNRVDEEGIQDRVLAVEASMDSPPFELGSLDMIWSEGSIYNIGFKNGVEIWKKYLRNGGFMAISEITWLTAERPKEIDNYWHSVYPEISTASAKIAVLEKAGFEILGYFPIPISDWTENYYRPLLNGFSAFRERNYGNSMVEYIITNEAKEFAMYEKYCKYYSYGFYVARKFS